MLEARRSLQTYAPTRARLLAAIYVPRVMEAFRMVKAEEFSRDDARALVLACFRDLQAQVQDGYLPSTTAPELEVLEQQELAREHIAQLEACVRSREFGGVVVFAANQLASASGVKLDRVAPTRRVDVFEGVARALIEQQHIFLAKASLGRLRVI